LSIGGAGWDGGTGRKARALHTQRDCVYTCRYGMGCRYMRTKVADGWHCRFCYRRRPRARPADETRIDLLCTLTRRLCMRSALSSQRQRGRGCTQRIKASESSRAGPSSSTSPSLPSSATFWLILDASCVVCLQRLALAWRAWHVQRAATRADERSTPTR
jgi:hypothetical protein